MFAWTNGSKDIERFRIPIENVSMKNERWKKNYHVFMELLNKSQMQTFMGIFFHWKMHK